MLMNTSADSKNNDSINRFYREQTELFLMSCEEFKLPFGELGHCALNHWILCFGEYRLNIIILW